MFAAVAEEVGRLLGGDITLVTRFDAAEIACVAAAWAPVEVPPPAGGREPLGGRNVSTRVHVSGRPARVGIGRENAAAFAEPGAALRLRASVGAPISVDGGLWGALIVGWATAEEPPMRAERALVAFARPLATAISSVNAREAMQTLADEQAALRRVATLIARGAQPADVFTAVAAQVAGLLPVTSAAMGRFDTDGLVTTVAAWSAAGVAFPVGIRWDPGGNNVTGIVFATGGSARLDDFSDASGPIGIHARKAGYRSAVGSPITVEGRLWGLISAASTAAEPLPADAEARLASFTELVATAIANTESRSRLKRLVDEQAALRRVAMLVAQQSSPDEVFTAVTTAVGPLVGADLAAMHVYPGDGTATTIAGWSESGPMLPIGTRLPLDGDSVAGRVFRTGAPARMDSYGGVGGDTAEVARGLQLRSTIGAPILVGGALWGALMAATRGTEPLSSDAGGRLAAFTELVATAVSNANAREDVQRLAEEQAALRRVATLVAEAATPQEVFARVAEETARVLGEVETSLWRDERDGTATVVAVSGVAVPIGTRMNTDGDGVIATVLREGRPYRTADTSGRTGAIVERGRRLGIKSAIGCPVVVGGRVWGALGAARDRPDAFPPGSEWRIAEFADLAATAIANAQAHAELERLAEERAALRRVATLVAQGAEPTAVFDSVAAEVKRVLDAPHVVVCRYEAGAELTTLAHHGAGEHRVPAGKRLSHQGECVEDIVRRTNRPATMDTNEGARGVIPEMARAAGVRASVGAPVVVAGRIWGVIAAGWGSSVTSRADAEQRLAKFAQLLGTAIANADSRDQLTASRARLLAADDEARRRVVRDLHRGAQQRLSNAIIALAQAQRTFERGVEEIPPLLTEALEQAEKANMELRELAHDILPGVLARGGLRAGVRALMSRLNIPLEADLTAERCAEEIEASAYFVIAGALANAEHRHATRAEVRTVVENGLLHVEVRDDGLSGEPPPGPGLVGIDDRISALGGQLQIVRLPGAGTRVSAALPVSLGKGD